MKLRRPKSIPEHFTPLEIRAPIDSGCLIDGEKLEPSNLLGNLLNDMRDFPMSYLEKHYPEFTFGFHFGTGKPKGHAFTAKFRAGWRFADWRVK